MASAPCHLDRLLATGQSGGEGENFTMLDTRKLADSMGALSFQMIYYTNQACAKAGARFLKVTSGRER